MFTYENEIEEKATKRVMIRVAKKLIELDVSLEIIKEATNLSEETLKKLQVEINL